MRVVQSWDWTISNYPQGKKEIVLSLFDTIREVDDAVPDELPTSGDGGYTSVMKIAKVGFFTPPSWKIDAAVKRGDTPPDRMFLLALEPLDFKFDTEPSSMIFQSQENMSVSWFNYKDKKGRFISPNSPFGTIKDAFRELGINIRTNEDCKPLVGRIVRVLTSGKVYVPVKPDEAAAMTPEDLAKEMRKRAIWTDKVVEFLPNDWKYSGPVPMNVRRRGYAAGSDNAASHIPAGKEQAEAAKLVEALKGTGKESWINALINADLSDPYVTEAVVADGAALISRMSRYGLDFKGGVFVESNS